MQIVSAKEVELPQFMFARAFCPNCENDELVPIELFVDKGYLTCKEKGISTVMCDSCLTVFKVTWSRDQAILKEVKEDED